MVKTRMVLDMVKDNYGIKAGVIAIAIGCPVNSVSGMLTWLKHTGKVYNDVNSKWYGVSRTDPIIAKLKDLDAHKVWAEGYVSALADHNIIDENEFDDLIEYCKTLVN